MNSQLHFICGKMASGKSTLSKELAQEHNAILLSEDEILAKLYPNEIKNISEYIEYSGRVKKMLKEYIIDTLKNDCNIVLDFPANTKEQREWFKEIFQEAWVNHTLHFIDKSDETCKTQLTFRSKDLPKDTPFTSEKEFDMITKYFEEPQKSENFNIIRYE